MAQAIAARWPGLRLAWKGYGQAMSIVQRLETTGDLTDGELAALIRSPCLDGELREAADRVRRQNYGDRVFIRGLVEFTSHCRNDCLYCGLRCSNRQASRYRLAKDEVLECCGEGYELGFRTFVLQGGEDPFFGDDVLVDLVAAIHRRFPDCAITLSVGERSRESYRALREAGAERYLLRHETASPAHYGRLHPRWMSHGRRLKCLMDLKDLGYQVGSGFMVGSPFQTVWNLVADLRFLQRLRPAMVGIGPFIPQGQTPFAAMPGGTLELTLRMLSILRLMFPKALIPSTTALGSIHPQGRILGLKSGGNVVMPNLSPLRVRKMYAIYDNKAGTGDEAAQGVESLAAHVAEAGYRLVVDRGDSLAMAASDPSGRRGR